MSRVGSTPISFRQMSALVRVSIRFPSLLSFCSILQNGYSAIDIGDFAENKLDRDSQTTNVLSKLFCLSERSKNRGGKAKQIDYRRHTDSKV